MAEPLSSSRSNVNDAGTGTVLLAGMSLDARVLRELGEVVALLGAAVGIADGLVALLDHAYDHDHRTSAALAAANTLAVALDEERLAAEGRLDLARRARG